MYPSSLEQWASVSSTEYDPALQTDRPPTISYPRVRVNSAPAFPNLSAPSFRPNGEEYPPVAVYSSVDWLSRMPQTSPPSLGPFHTHASMSSPSWDPVIPYYDTGSLLRSSSMDSARNLRIGIHRSSHVIDASEIVPSDHFSVDNVFQRYVPISIPATEASSYLVGPLDTTLSISSATGSQPISQPVPLTSQPDRPRTPTPITLTDRQRFFREHLPPNPSLQNLALEIETQPWFIFNQEEPPLHENEPVVLEGLLPPGNSHSRFDLFFDPNGRRRCRWIEANQRCNHESARVDRARGHAHSHFNYKIFACEEKCGKAGCQERYTREALLRDHINRTQNPTRTCDICLRAFTTQNFRRHMRLHQ